ncbi:hypothetical protein GAH_01108 [Geoglobus ahangari]|uniref:Uncharacterized protein n=1 Tax=Geoglobus ahangari TaxID=113653 RepID=A0A0F7DBS0_9EURY|nr:hypothetical protein [Geoglobus ahangari]AKG91576.1 hypothetical protein GAH_01108 [Geoglobus ahangari]NOY11594.1 hypothetical protein [Archaeoglobi archaeon]
MASASAASHAESEYKKVICSACDFYKPGDTLECAAFKVLKYLVETGKLTLEEVDLAVSQACRKSSA